MASIFQNIGDVWNRAPLIHRVMLLGILLALLVAGGGLIYWSTQPSLALLYAGLAPEEAASIVERIRDQDIAYDLKDGGTSVYVPTEQVYSLRLALAADGMPVGQTQAGYEVLQDQPIGQSLTVQRVNIVRAAEGELAKTIQTLNGVTACRVHVVRPEAAIFTGRRDEATATVVIKTRSGYMLSGANVAAIVHLVSGAVESLKPQNVVVIDADTNTPLTGGEDGGIGGPGGAMATRRMQIEQELARKAEAVLTQVLGPGRAKVEVSVELTNEDTLTVSRQYEPKGTTSREEIVSETETGGSSSVGSRKSENIVTEYETGMTFTERMVKAGEIESRNVAAVVDLYPPEAEGEEGAAGALLMTEEQVKGLISDAVGLTDADSLTVVNQRFFDDGSGVEPLAEGGLFSKDFLLDMGKRISLGLLVVGALLALKMFGGSSSKTAKQAARAALPGEVVEEDQREALAQPQLDPDLLRTQITHALEDNPDEVKQLFLSWVESQN